MVSNAVVTHDVTYKYNVVVQYYKSKMRRNILLNISKLNTQILLSTEIFFFENHLLFSQARPSDQFYIELSMHDVPFAMHLRLSFDLPHSHYQL